MITALCPHCHTEVSVGPLPEVGQRVVCARCARELEVIWLYPISLDYPEEAIPLQQTIPTPVRLAHNAGFAADDGG